MHHVYAAQGQTIGHSFLFASVEISNVKCESSIWQIHHVLCLLIEPNLCSIL